MDAYLRLGDVFDGIVLLTAVKRTINKRKLQPEERGMRQ